jgi:hypothetical protein
MTKAPPIKDITGQRFGKLVAIKLADKKGKQYRWLCQCDCGNQTLTFGFSLRMGQSKSCGCVAAEKSRQRWENPTPEMRAAQSAKVKKTHQKSKHPTYQVWSDMRARCGKETHKWFSSYGGRGITVCDRWLHSFENFWEDIGQHWQQGLQLGRIDNDKGYSPENCRWETPLQQQSNKSNNRFVETPNGKLTVAEAARQFGVSAGCIRHRITAGYATDQILKPSQRAHQ